ncbi:MAG: glycosyltransferase [Nanoarchaeota archaeon]
MDSLSLIIPAHNSAKVIEDSLYQYYDIFSKKFKKLEIIVVCNGCSDETENICISLKKKIPLKVISIQKRGKGYALTAGFNEAQYNLMGFLDADNPFDLNKISDMIDYLNENDVVIVSKYLRGKKRKQDYLLRRLVSLGGFVFSRIIFDMNFRDTQAGAKFFKKEVWPEINKKNKFVCNGFDWDIEFLYKAKKNKFKIADVYIPVNSEKFSTFKLKYLPGMVKRLVILRFLK